MLRLRGAVLGCMPALTTAQTLWREQLGGWQSGTVLSFSWAAVTCYSR